MSDSVSSLNSSSLAEDQPMPRQSFFRRSLRLTGLQSPSKRSSGRVIALPGHRTAFDNGSIAEYSGSNMHDDVVIPIRSQGILLQSRSVNGLILLVQEGTILTETNEFRVPGSGITIKLNQVTNIHGTECKILTVQVILLKPEKDILMVSVKTDNQQNQAASICKLTSDSKSLILELRPCRKIDLDGDGTIYRSYIFSLEVVNSPFTGFYHELDPVTSDIVVKCDDGTEIRTLKQNLLKSAVLKEKVDNGQQVIEIMRYPTLVVEQMVKFLTHDYCSFWDSPHQEDLVRIAEEYGINGMKTLADSKKKLLS